MVLEHDIILAEAADTTTVLTGITTLLTGSIELLI